MIGGNRKIPLGWGLHGAVELSADAAIKGMSLTVGRTGAGKTAALLSRMLFLIRHFPRDVRVCLLDGKGEASRDLLGRFLPAIHAAGNGPPPTEVAVFSPWREGSLAELNLLAEIPGLPRDLHANIACNLFERFIGEGLGPRMRPILQNAMQAVMELRGTLLDVLRIIEDDEVAAHIGRQTNPEVAHYLLHILPTEPKASRTALRARLGHLLSLRQLRAMLLSRGSVSGRDFLAAPLSVINLGEGPLGHSELSLWLGQWLFHVLTAAVFARPEVPNRPHLFLVLDEFQTMVDSAADLERLLTQSRWKDTSVHLCTQSLEQVRDGRLIQTALANISLFCAFSPRDSDLNHFGHLIPITGRMVNPELPDRTLSKAEEREAIVQQIRRLPPRHAWLVNLAQGGESQTIRTLDLPYQQAAEVVARLSEAQREAFWRGRFGRTVAELEQASPRPLVPPLGGGPVFRDPLRRDRSRRVGSPAGTTSATDAAGEPMGEDTPSPTTSRRKRSTRKMELP